MDALTHTIVALVALLIAYFVGYRHGENRGTAIGVAMLAHWIQEKIGMAQWRVWEKEMEADAEAAENSEH